MSQAGNGLAAVNVTCGEEESDFRSSGFSSVGAVNCVGVDAVGEIGADGAGLSFLGIGGAHQVAVGLNGIFAFQNLHEHGTRDHEIYKILEEGTLFVNSVRSEEHTS